MRPRPIERAPQARSSRLAYVPGRLGPEGGRLGPGGARPQALRAPGPLRELALGDPAVALDLLRIDPVAGHGRGRGELEAAHQPVRYQGPAAVLLHEVAPDLEVPLPEEVRMVVVGGEAGESRLHGDAESVRTEPDPAGGRVERDRQPDGERE